MSRHLHAFGTLSTLGRGKRRVLARELADYATPAERDELEALIEATGAADDEAARILRGQTQAQLFQVICRSAAVSAPHLGQRRGDPLAQQAGPARAPGLEQPQQFTLHARPGGCHSCRVEPGWLSTVTLLEDGHRPLLLQDPPRQPRRGLRRRLAGLVQVGRKA